MKKEDYIYRGVAEFDGGGYGGRLNLSTPWMSSIQDVNEYVNKYFSAIPTTWSINSEVSGVYGHGVQNVEQFTITPGEHARREDFYILLYGAEETFIALGYSVDNLKAQVLSEKLGARDVPFSIYHGKGAITARAPREPVISFTRGELEESRDALEKIPEAEVVKHLERHGYSISKEQ